MKKNLLRLVVTFTTALALMLATLPVSASASSGNFFTVAAFRGCADNSVNISFAGNAIPAYARLSLHNNSDNWGQDYGGFSPFQGYSYPVGRNWDVAAVSIPNLELPVSLHVPGCDAGATIGPAVSETVNVDGGEQQFAICVRINGEVVGMHPYQARDLGFLVDDANGNATPANGAWWCADGEPGDGEGPTDPVITVHVVGDAGCVEYTGTMEELSSDPYYLFYYSSDTGEYYATPGVADGPCPDPGNGGGEEPVVAVQVAQVNFTCEDLTFVVTNPDASWNTKNLTIHLFSESEDVFVGYGVELVPGQAEEYSVRAAVGEEWVESADWPEGLVTAFIYYTPKGDKVESEAIDCSVATTPPGDGGDSGNEGGTDSGDGSGTDSGNEGGTDSGDGSGTDSGNGGDTGGEGTDSGNGDGISGDGSEVDSAPVASAAAETPAADPVNGMPNTGDGSSLGGEASIVPVLASFAAVVVTGCWWWRLNFGGSKA